MTLNTNWITRKNCLILLASASAASFATFLPLALAHSWDLTSDISRCLLVFPIASAVLSGCLAIYVCNNKSLSKYQDVGLILAGVALFATSLTGYVLGYMNADADLLSNTLGGMIQKFLGSAASELTHQSVCVADCAISISIFSVVLLALIGAKYIAKAFKNEPPKNPSFENPSFENPSFENP